MVVESDWSVLRIKVRPHWRERTPRKPERRAGRARGTASRAHLPGWPRGNVVEDAAAYVGLGVSTWLREVAEDRAPKPFHLTPGRVVWDRYDLDRWFEDRKAAEQDREAPNPWDAPAP